MKTIGILYVGIGAYIRFWDDFYSTCERYFCPNSKKHYYLVTNSQMEEKENVTVVYQDDLGWPGNTLFRHFFFFRIKDTLKEHDYLFSFNGNTRFRQTVNEEEFLPIEEEGGLIALTWKTGNEDPDTYNFERRPESAAYIPYGTKSIYLQGGLTGGITKHYFEFWRACHEITMTDFNNGIIPRFHDESILNKYMLNRTYKLLCPTYGCPSQRTKKYSAKIVFQRKEDVLGRSWLRHYKKLPHSDTWLRKLLRKMGLVK